MSVGLAVEIKVSSVVWKGQRSMEFDSFHHLEKRQDGSESSQESAHSSELGSNIYTLW